MTTAFESQLGALTAQLCQLCSMATQAMDDATCALVEHDGRRAQDSIDGRREVDAMSAGVREATMLLLSMRAPVAADLAAAIDAVRIAVNAECMADLAVKVAEVSFRRPDGASSGVADECLADIGASAVALAQRVNDALLTGDARTANDIIRGHDVTIRLRRPIAVESVDNRPDSSPGVADDLALLEDCYRYFVEHVVRIARCVAGGTACRGTSSLQDITSIPNAAQFEDSAASTPVPEPRTVTRMLKGLVSVRHYSGKSRNRRLPSAPAVTRSENVRGGRAFE